MRILGIETSCDETAAAIVDARGVVLSQALTTQKAEHEIYGGVVPEIAARAHLAYLPKFIRSVLHEAHLTLSEIDAFAATAGPGLVGGLLVGSMMAKGMAFSTGKPFLAINHLEAHALSVRMVAPVAFPFLLLLVSGGHTQLLIVKGVGDYALLGSTIDDALGEAFDKTAQLLGLGYPGGRFVEEFARGGDPRRYSLPRPLLGKPGCDFSFSGLKTAVRKLVYDALGDEFSPPFSPEQQIIVQDICASFQAAVADVVVERSQHAIAICHEAHYPVTTFVMAGGVAANQFLRQSIKDVANDAALDLVVPPPALCADNAAMVAWAGIERFQIGQVDALNTRVRPVWPLAPKKESFKNAMTISKDMTS